MASFPRSLSSLRLFRFFLLKIPRHELPYHATVSIRVGGGKHKMKETALKPNTRKSELSRSSERRNECSGKIFCARARFPRRWLLNPDRGVGLLLMALVG